jgi:hypothetical protein
MMLRGKQVKELQFLLTDPVTGKTFPVGTDKVLNIKQKTHMETRPDMILQYAHYLADTYQAKTHVRPVVKVTAIESLNFRSPQYLIDPNVDLAAQTDSLMPASWIVPLAPPTANPAASIDGATIQSSHVDDE